MGRAPCCDKANVKKGPWSPEEDAKLKDYIEKHGTGGNWIALPQKVGLKRCGKSCRLRWLNYLRPNIKHGEFSEAEDRIICTLFATIGSRWSIIASQLQGRTDNDIKNYWNTKLKKKMMASMDPPPSQSSSFRDNSTYCYHHHHPQGSNFNASGSGCSYSFTSSILSGNSSTNSAASANSNFQLSQEGFMNSSMFVFGGDAAAAATTTTTASCCSSSDGSCNNNQMSSSGHHVIEAAEFGDGAFVNCLYGGGIEDTERQSEMLWGENALDYGIQDIKHLIGTTSTSCSNNFLFDEIKAEERVMY